LLVQFGRDAVRETHRTKAPLLYFARSPNRSRDNARGEGCRGAR
jgi:hypothetical protein